jgi:hypothetical protein
MEEPMTLMEKMRYMPQEGDILIFNDGAFMEVLEYKKGLEVTVKWCAKGAEPSEIKKHIPEIRTQLVSDKLHLCRKEANDVQDNPDPTEE